MHWCRSYVKHKPWRAAADAAAAAAAAAAASRPAFSSYFHKMAKIDRVLPLYVINGCVKYEFDTRIGVAVT